VRITKSIPKQNIGRCKGKKIPDSTQTAHKEEKVQKVKVAKKSKEKKKRGEVKGGKGLGTNRWSRS